jgi:ligand-binding sensor domain-containing protein
VGSRLLICIFFFYAAYSLARIPEAGRFKLINRDAGLATEHVTALATDHKGFAWIGTSDGLFRYDGNSFLEFKQGVGKAGGLRSAHISCLFAQSNGLVWIGTMHGGLSYYDPRRDSILSFPAAGKFSLENEYLLAVFEDSKQIVWISTTTTVYRINTIDKDSHRTFSISAFTQVPRPVNSFSEDSKGNIWMCTAVGMYCYERTIKKIQLLEPLVTNESDLIRDRFCCVAKMIGDSMLWVGTWGGGIKAYSLHTKKWKTYYFHESNSSSGVQNIVTDLDVGANGDIWFASPDMGLGQLDPREGQFTFVRGKTLNGLEFPGSEIYRLKKAMNGQWWAGGLYGLASLNLQNPWFQFLEVPNKRAQFFSMRPSRSEKNTWLMPSTYFPFAWSMDVEKKIWKSLPQPSDNSNSSFYDIETLGKDHLLAATSDGLFKYANARWERCLDDKNQTFGGVYHFQNEGDSILWMLCERFGALRYHLKTRKTTKIHQGDVKSFFIVNRPVHRRQWFTGTNGMIEWLDNGTKHGYSHLPKREKIRCIESQNDSIAWIGTDHSGVLRFDSRRNSFAYIAGTHNGLPSNRIFSIRVDGDLLWLSTARGLVWFNTQTSAFRIFDQASGLKATYLEHGLEIDDSYVLVGSVNGFYIAKKKDLLRQTVQPLVYLSKSLIDGEQTHSISEEVRPGKHRLEVAIGEISWSLPSGTKWFYQLKGHIDRWTPLRKGETVVFPELSAGTYTFIIRQASADAVYAEKSLFQLHIKQFWYKTYGFMGCCAALIVLLIVVIRKEIIKRKRSRIKLKKDLASLEMRALRAQMNPHFIFNCLNAINRFIVNNQADGATRYLARFSKLIRMILENASQDAISVETEVESLQLYLQLESLRFDGRFHYFLEIEPELLNYKIPPMIIQPYIENAIWHGLLHKKGDGSVTIRAKMLSNGMSWAIIDDGIGRAAAEEIKARRGIAHKSHGMHVTQDRLKAFELMYGKKTSLELIDLIDVTGKPCGTQVNIFIPTM